MIQLSAEVAAGRDVTLEMEIVSRHLRDVELNRLPQIAKRLGRTVEQVKAAIENLSHLNPRPGLLVGERAAPVVIPEIQVDLDEEGRVVVTMSDDNTPDLQISRAYRKLARDRKTPQEVRQFIQRNVRSAQWLISAVAQRRDTVRRVVEEVFKVQRDFLEQGREALRPLPMVDVAGKVGVHVATVSRAVAGKYVQTPRGIFPLRMFFSGGTKTAGGEEVAWDAVKVKLKEIVDAEDKSKPPNDDQLAEALKSHGLEIARRTVAKYRKLLNIPPARQRREY
jgi:RNA polymerase sigma-54 factor